MEIVRGNKATVLQLIERVWRQGHIEDLPKFWTADCINHADPAADNRGLEALRLYHLGFGQFFVDFEGVEIEVQQQIAEDDRVVTQLVARAMHKPTRRNVHLATIRIDRFVSDKIAEHWSVADMAGLMQQIG